MNKSSKENKENWVAFYTWLKMNQEESYPYVSPEEVFEAIKERSEEDEEKT